jgi:uncharacterized membrane protein YgcG
LLRALALLTVCLALACSSSEPETSKPDPLASAGDLLNAIQGTACEAAKACSKGAARFAGCGYAIEAQDCAAYSKELAGSAAAAQSAGTLCYYGPNAGFVGESLASLCLDEMNGLLVKAEDGKTKVLSVDKLESPTPDGPRCIAAADDRSACGDVVAPPAPRDVAGRAFDQPLSCRCALAAPGELPSGCLNLLVPPPDAAKAKELEAAACAGQGGSGGSGGHGGSGGSGGAGGSGGTGGGGSGGA